MATKTFLSRLISIKTFPSAFTITIALATLFCIHFPPRMQLSINVYVISSWSFIFFETWKMQKSLQSLLLMKNLKADNAIPLHSPTVIWCMTEILFFIRRDKNGSLVNEKSFFPLQQFPADFYVSPFAMLIINCYHTRLDWLCERWILISLLPLRHRHQPSSTMAI